MKPALRSVGSNLVKVAKSDSAKSAMKSLGRQSLESALNLAQDAITGSDLRDGFQREKKAMKKNISGLIEKERVKLRGNNKRSAKKGLNNNKARVKKRKGIMSDFDDGMV